MKKITLKELLDESTELGRARRKQLAANFEEMVRRARTADLSWMEEDERRRLESNRKIVRAGIAQLRRSRND